MCNNMEGGQNAKESEIGSSIPCTVYMCRPNYLILSMYNDKILISNCENYEHFNLNIIIQYLNI